MQDTMIQAGFATRKAFQYYAADSFPWMNPVHWLTSHFAVGGWSPLSRLSGMLTAHMTRIAPRNGFAWHPHRGLEIYTWVIEGQLYHEDTTGGSGVIQAGELQRMFSGNYIEHQELNPYDEPARVIQIWFAAGYEHVGVAPHYQQLSAGELHTITTGDATTTDLVGGDSAMEQHMKGRITATTLKAGGKMALSPPRAGEDLFFYVTDGTGTAQNGTSHTLGLYDVILATPQVETIDIEAAEDQALYFLSFYLPSFLPG